MSRTRANAELSPTVGALPKTKEGEHAAGSAFFGAVRIVSRQVARGADPGIMNDFCPCVPTLLHDLSGEIDFVIRGTNTRTQLDEEVLRA